MIRQTSFILVLILSHGLHTSVVPGPTASELTGCHIFHITRLRLPGGHDADISLAANTNPYTSFVSREKRNAEVRD